jgi:hypothetical protein
MAIVGCESAPTSGPQLGAARLEFQFSCQHLNM